MNKEYHSSGNTPCIFVMPQMRILYLNRKEAFYWQQGQEYSYEAVQLLPSQVLVQPVLHNLDIVLYQHKIYTDIRL